VGLALSRRLAEAMNGRLALASAAGPGTTFVIDLPTAQTETVPGAPQPTVTAVEEHIVLYIEDNLSNLRLVERVVGRSPGWRLVHALHGQLGIELAQAQRPALILLDLHLPDMSGEHVLRALRASSATAQVPVWFITADATPGQAQRLLDAGADGHMTKPVNIAELIELLDSTAAHH
jgi:CheY-like chemotaxis protein